MMAEYDAGWKHDDEEEDESQDIDENSYKAQKDALILALEVSQSMLAAPPPSSSKKADHDSPLLAALKCAYHLMEQRIISSPKDMMGILLFGTEKTKFMSEDYDRGGLGYPNCYLLTDLDVPAAEDVKALKSLVEDGEDEEGILTPSTEAISMSNVLFCANQIFTVKAANFGSRRLFIITDNDDPHSSDKGASSAAAVRAKDLYDLGVTIDLFPITQSDKKFDFSIFYDDIVYHDAVSEASLASNTSISKSCDGLTLLSSLISNINSKQTPKRALFSNLTFQIAPGFHISVKGYNIIHRQTPARTCYVWLDGEKLQIASGETSRIAEDSTRSVTKEDIKKAYKFGGEYVYFTTEEQKCLRDFGSPIIRLIGFKPRQMLPFWASVKKSTFIYPSEEDYVGSTRVFAALWRKLLMDDKIGIAWCIVRANAQPMLAAVIPSKAQVTEEGGAPSWPDGLWLYPLPFADDVREIKSPLEAAQSSDELKTKMRTIAQQLQLPKAIYNPQKNPNPALQWHYKIFKALALEEEVPQKAEDATAPRCRAIAKRAGGYLEEWTERLEMEQGLTLDTRNLKREAEDAESLPATKKRQTMPEIGDGSSLTWTQLRTAIDSGGIAKMTVPQLRDILGKNGLNTIGRKMELVERIEQWVEKSS